MRLEASGFRFSALGFLRSKVTFHRPTQGNKAHSASCKGALLRCVPRKNADVSPSKPARIDIITVLRGPDPLLKGGTILHRVGRDGSCVVRTVPEIVENRMGKLFASLRRGRHHCARGGWQRCKQDQPKSHPLTPPGETRATF